jgi:hypothetical protein
MAKKKETQMTINLKTVTRKLPCKLNDDELRTKGDELAVTCQEIANEQTNAKQIKDQLKMKMSELEARKGQLALTISRREEYRDVEVVVDFLETGDNAGQVRETRKDTSEVMVIRPPMDSERQPELKAPLVV